MEQIAILNDTYVSIMGVNGLFLIAQFILLWMMFRGVTNANLHGANTFGKVLHSVISLCVVGFISSTFSNIASTLNNWALSVSESGEELTGGLQQFVDQMGATQYISGGLFPADPLSIVFVLAILVGLIGGMWMAPAPKD
tara:strand:+ start:3047 stop:3466 length:420 start_codon:yes stop_codon:yes gene_type:complete